MGKLWRFVAVAALGVAVILAAGVERLPVDAQPVDAAMYVELGEDLATGDGYRVEGMDHVRYPPGLPALLAPFTLFDAETLFSFVAMVALAVAVWVTGWRMGGPVAATVAVLLVATAPHMERMGGFILSDITTAAFTVLAVLAWHEGRRVLAGVLLGWTAVLRISSVAVIAAASLTNRRVLYGALPVLGALAVFWWVAPFGYSDGETGWSLSYLWSSEGMIRNDEGATLSPNLIGIPKILLGLRDGVGGLMLPWVALVGFYELARRRAWFPLSIIASLVVIHLPYFAQCERFLLPATVILNLYIGLAVARLSGDQNVVEPGRGRTRNDPVVLRGAVRGV